MEGNGTLARGRDKLEAEINYFYVIEQDGYFGCCMYPDDRC